MDTSKKGRHAAGRDYAGFLTRTSQLSGDRTARMKAFVDLAWEAFHAANVSWIGFYLIAADRREMLLGPRRDKPACSPIGLHGACGQACRSGKVLVVRDVRELGADYIACDPRDQSELVIPLFEPTNASECWGVLDVDSHAVGAFSEEDAQQMTAALRGAGLTPH